MKVEMIKISQLKFAEYNPRKMTEKEAQDLQASLKEFGFVENIVVNCAPERRNIVIGGHQRIKAAQQMGQKEVPVYFVNIPNIKREKELNLRLNKNMGQWDFEKLAKFDEDLLKSIGFEADELAGLFALNDIDDFEVNEERFNIISIEPPECPKLKERIVLECKSFKDYEKLKKYFIKNGSDKIMGRLLSL